MSRRFDAEPVLARLTDFQRATVDHVCGRFYGPAAARRFLVADETGLGKSVVAGGVIARTIEHLQDDDSVGRIDIVYVCSNGDIARQNLSRLDVTGQRQLAVASRLTLLAKHARDFEDRSARLAKPVNLVSFTPGTSFEMGWQTGMAEERALLYLILQRELGLVSYADKAARLLLQGGVQQLKTFDALIARLEAEIGKDVDQRIVDQFCELAGTSGLRDRFASLVTEMGRKHSVPNSFKDEVRDVIGGLRNQLARAGVETLEPDLVILDEFQRFRHLLDQSKPAGELAHHLFEYGASKVLLLSATPYKPFTYAEEAENHHEDFLQTVRFLAAGSTQPALAAAIDSDLAAYRRAVTTGAPAVEVASRVRESLLLLMSRQERPDNAKLHMVADALTTPVSPQAADLVEYVRLAELARQVGGRTSVEYWKSVPYFANFMDGYQLGDKTKAALKAGTDAQLTNSVRQLRRIERSDVETFRPIDQGNVRLRALAEDTVDSGWWQLLWVPPALPYFAPSGPYADPGIAGMTKRLIFSSWTAVPTAIASLLSYEVDRRIATAAGIQTNTPEARRSQSRRLVYSLSGGRPQAMTTLALFWPMPGLALAADPRRIVRETGAALAASDVIRQVEASLMSALPTGDTTAASGSESWYWSAALRLRPTAVDDAASWVPEVEQAVRGLAGTTAVDAEEPHEEPDEPLGVEAHVLHAVETLRGQLPESGLPADLAEVVARLGLFAPGNVAFRSLSRLAADHVAVDRLWEAAAVLGSGLRSLFRRPETTALLDHVVGTDVPYWRAVLEYIRMGNLEAVLDEFLHHLVLDEGIRALDEAGLLRLAHSASAAMSIRPSRYTGFDPVEPDNPIAFSARFALRYGGKRGAEDSARGPEIRRAFNSPFWPFVLATTSAGQEGIDFHWWCHAIVHWNTPANPVDVEQREGRVHRYSGHAVRKNIVERHAAAMLRSSDPDPWHAGYELAIDERPTFGDFTPRWVYPGSAKVERHLLPFPLSTDVARLARLKRDVALYRLTFGQPRQEDMLELIAARDGEAGSVARVNLAPPGSKH